MLELVESYAKSKCNESSFYSMLASDLENLSDEIREEVREIFSSIVMKEELEYLAV